MLSAEFEGLVDVASCLIFVGLLPVIYMYHYQNAAKAKTSTSRSSRDGRVPRPIQNCDYFHPSAAFTR